MEELNPRTGGNPLLDQVLGEHPDYMSRLLTAGMQPPHQAYKTLFGEDFPTASLLSSTQDSRSQFIANHAALQSTLMKHMAESALDPTRGMSLGAAAKLFNQNVEDLATPEQSQNTLTRPGRLPEQEGPPQQKATFLGSPDTVAGRAMDPYFAPRESTREPDLQVIDPTQQLNSPQRALAGSEIQRRRSPYYGMVRGKAANTQAMLSQAAAAMGLEPGTDEFNQFMAQGNMVGAGMYKGTAQPGSAEAQGIEASTDLKKSYKAGKDLANQYAPQAAQDKHNNTESLIAARNKARDHATATHLALDNLRKVQTQKIQLENAGQHPNQALRATQIDNTQDAKDFAQMFMGAADPKDLFTTEFQNELINGMAQRLGGTPGVSGTDKSGIIKKAGKATGLIDEPPVEVPNRPTKGRAATALEEAGKRTRGGMPDIQHPQPRDAGEHLKALEAELGNLSQHEGKTFKDTATGKSYKIQGGHAIEVQ